MSGTILIIGDSDRYAQRLSRALADIGCSATVVAIDSASSVDECLEEGHRPALVLLDDRLLGASSLPILDAIRAQGSWSDVPVVILTGDEEARDHGSASFGSATLTRATGARFERQVRQLAERFLNDWLPARSGGDPPRSRN